MIRFFLKHLRLRFDIWSIAQRLAYRNATQHCVAQPTTTTYLHVASLLSCIMCGILAALGVSPSALPADIRKTVLRGLRTLRHRGPDWSGCYAAPSGRFVLGHARLSIVGVDGGAQPLYYHGPRVEADDSVLGEETIGQPNETPGHDIVLSVNGEIYNHKKLRAQLPLTATAKFYTASDCEVLMHLYAAHGPSSAFLNMIDGMFGFAMIDEEKQTALVARDHLGIIPLYYGRDSAGTVWVSSEIKALFDICVTFHEFPPGHFMTISATGETKLERWYQPTWYDSSRFAVPTEQKDASVTGTASGATAIGARDHLSLSDSSIKLDALTPELEAVTKTIRDTLEKCVVSHLMSDAPYGVLLSGGLDSSIIAAIAARHAAKRVEADEKTAAHWPRLHSFAIGLRDSPDLAAARRAATYLDTVHHEFTYSIRDGIDALSDVIHHQETADVTTTRAGTALFLLARCIRATGVKMVLSGEGSDEIFGGYLYFHKCPSAKELQAELVRKLQDLHTFDCLRANKSTAAWGVEARVPFLSRPFLDFAMNDVAPAYKLCGREAGGRIEKWILRRAFVGYLPDDILWRQKEQFSDGVGTLWIDSLKRHAALRVTDHEFKAATTIYPHSTPSTKEGILYRRIYEEHFGGHRDAIALLPGGPSIACSTAVAIQWDASFAAFADCSGRSVKGVHAAAYDDKHRAAGAITGESLVGAATAAM